MRKVSVPVGAGYDILIGAGLLGQAGQIDCGALCAKQSCHHYR